MSDNPQIQTTHLQRSAYVYIRQSTAAQVAVNRESTDRQYRLRERALQLGWPQERIKIIDEDLAHSGSGLVLRQGFTHLTAEVALGHAGLILSLEVSRVARNNADWYRLLDLCGVTDTLIGDEDGIYHPGLFNDRLLLGLKGTLAEAELHVLRGRLDGGIRNGTWVAPFIMAPINTRVVRRSAALNAAYRTPYGPGFRYHEYTKFGPPLAAAKATAMAAAMRGFDRVMEHGAARALLGAVLPKPGEGPSEATMASGWFKTDLIGRTADGRTARARIAYAGDPGNRATLRILCEAGLALAFDDAKLPGAPKRGGVLTPATAIGEALVPRLRKAGFEISVGR